MDDVDQDADGDQDPDGDADADGDVDGDEDENDEEDDDDDQDNAQDSPLRRQSQNGTYPSTHLQSGQRIAGDDSSPHSSMQRTSSNAYLNLVERPSPRPEAVTATMYDIVPSIAAPQATSINTLAATADMRWVFSGGSDGFVRRFNWQDTVNSKSMLTVAQRHPYVDSVVKHGVLMSYWAPQEGGGQNNGYRQGSPVDALNISPIQSLAVHHQGLWVLVGVETGTISVHTVRHSESERIATLASHTSAVSALTLAHDERSVLSGSWDKSVLDWDLNTGQVSRRFGDGGGQISAIELRPESNLPVPPLSWPILNATDTFSFNYSARPNLVNNPTTNGETDHRDSEAMPNGNADAAGSPANSLFGDNGSSNSLFGDGGDGGSVTVPGDAVGDDYDDEFSRLMANGIRERDVEMTNGDIDIPTTAPQLEPPPSTAITNGTSTSQPNASRAHQQQPNGVREGGGGGGEGGGGAEAGAGAGGDPTQHDSLAMNRTHDAAAEDDLTHAGGPVQNAAATIFAAPGPDTNDDLPPTSGTTFFDTAMDGILRVWDRRQQAPIATVVPRWTPPWCMSACWAPDGNSIYVGRRNNTVDEFSLHKGFAEPSRIFRFPAGSGSVSAIRPMPNGRHLLW